MDLVPSPPAVPGRPDWSLFQPVQRFRLPNGGLVQRETAQTRSPSLEPSSARTDTQSGPGSLSGYYRQWALNAGILSAFREPPWWATSSFVESLRRSRDLLDDIQAPVVSLSSDAIRVVCQPSYLRPVHQKREVFRRDRAPLIGSSDELLRRILWFSHSPASSDWAAQTSSQLVVSLTNAIFQPRGVPSYVLADPYSETRDRRVRKIRQAFAFLIAIEDGRRHHIQRDVDLEMCGARAILERLQGQIANAIGEAAECSDSGVEVASSPPECDVFLSPRETRAGPRNDQEDEGSSHYRGAHTREAYDFRPGQMARRIGRGDPE